MKGHKMMKTARTLVAALAAGCICGALSAFAAEQIITQKDQQFSEASMTIQQGDTLVFQNDDDVVHNIMSMTPGSDFNLGALPPGGKVSQVFSKAGVVSVICAIHPRMKMTVNVVN